MPRGATAVHPLGHSGRGSSQGELGKGLRAAVNTPGLPPPLPATGAPRSQVTPVLVSSLPEGTEALVPMPLFRPWWLHLSIYHQILDKGVPRGTQGDPLGVTIFFPVPKGDVLPLTRVNIPGLDGDPLFLTTGSLMQGA